jgi:mono/diheme cytochrome c family protein
MRPLQALGTSVAATVTLLAATGAFAMVLQRHAASQSHEQPPYAWPPGLAGVPIPTRVTQGRTLFVKSCAHCHGLDATGDEGPDLHGLWVSDRRIAAVIKRGIKGEMPSFAKKHDDRQVAELVAYVRSLE